MGRSDNMKADNCSFTEESPKERKETCLGERERRRRLYTSWLVLLWMLCFVVVRRGKKGKLI